MGLAMLVRLLLVQLCAIAFALVLQGSAGYDISPSPPTFAAFPPIEEDTTAPFYQGKSLGNSGPGPASQRHGSYLQPPIAFTPLLPPIKSAPVPQTVKQLAPSLPPSTTTQLPPYRFGPPPLVVQGGAPSVPPSASQRKVPHEKAPISVSVAPVPVASPLRTLPKNSPTGHPMIQGSLPPSAHHRNATANEPPLSVPLIPVASPLRALPKNSPTAHPMIQGSLPPSAHQRNATANEPPHSMPITFVPVSSPPEKLQQSPPAIQPVMPEAPPPILPVPVGSPPSTLPQNSPATHPTMPREPPSTIPVPVGSSPSTLPQNSPATQPIMPGEPPPTLPDAEVPSITTPPPSVSRKRYGMPVAAPPNETPHSLSPVNNPSSRGSFPVLSPSTHRAIRHSNDAPAPAPSLSSFKSPTNKELHSPASSPPSSFYKYHHTRNKFTSPAPASSYLVPPHASKQGSIISPAPLQSHKSPLRSKQRHRAPPPFNPVSQLNFSFAPASNHVSSVPSPSPTAPSSHVKSAALSPKISPPRNPKKPPMVPVLVLPPPPPNEDCASILCTEPLTNTPPGSPCACVLPMQVGLRLSVALYTFFPLVSELAEEIASGVFMKQSQVRIMGANAASQQPEKTVVLIDLVPLGTELDHTTAFLIYQRFWRKKVVIKASFFGDYEVLYVHYPGLPPSPPSAPSSITIDNDGPYSVHDNKTSTMKPLGVDVRGREHKNELSGSVIAIVVLSAFIAVILCSAAAWFLLFKSRDHVSVLTPTPRTLLPSVARPSGIAGSMMGSGASSASLSFGSSIATYTGSAKTFSLSDIEKATDNFDASRILGEGGFGRVYSGVLEDGTKVAVKVLKRDDQQGGREFLAEVEMLSRLHHRNLVKLIGICIEDHTRCLVYELIPNGSVESHLHGVDKETSPLDWGARVKIALGAARGLAYLHEDSSPRVIHRDFKSSNILLEHDFTPKVSDFGLARAAMDEENAHISTRVMGTFGYVAPEYAMTGHLLVKSDVYSYGVVLLELLTGRKPVDMSQPPGQENLVAWARPLLTSREGLEAIIDPSLGSDFPFDSVAKVAAIASMCVQPEVSHRPFMGEVVQALKLVSNECDQTKEVGSRSCSQGDLLIDLDGGRISANSGQLSSTLQSQYPVPTYDSERGLSVSDLLSNSARFGREASGSFRRHSSSGPLRTGRGGQFWQRMKRLSGGSVSEHGSIFRLWPGSH